MPDRSHSGRFMRNSGIVIFILAIVAGYTLRAIPQDQRTGFVEVLGWLLIPLTLAATTVPSRLGRLLQTAFRRARTCTALSRRIHPPRGHLQQQVGCSL